MLLLRPSINASFPPVVLPPIHFSFYYPLKLLKMVQEKIIDWTDPEVRKEFEEEIKRWLVFSSNDSFIARTCISFIGLMLQIL